VSRLRVSGPLKVIDLESGGYEVAEEWWCDWSGFPGWNWALSDATARLFEKRLTLFKGFRFDGGSSVAIDKGGMQGYACHDAWYRAGRQSKAPQSHRAMADRLMYELHRHNGMIWIRARWLYAGVRLGAAAHFKPQPDKERIVRIAS
jgi:hypothetical protein